MIAESRLLSRYGDVHVADGRLAFGKVLDINTCNGGGRRRLKNCR